MTESEITLAQHYLARAGQDPVAALIRSVRDLALLRRHVAGESRLDVDRLRDRIGHGSRSDLSSPPIGAA